MTTDGAALITAVTGGNAPDVVRVDGGAGRLRCLVWGRATDPPLLVVHGNGGSALWWASLVPALVPGWRVVAPDLRGHGESDWAEPPAYGIEDFAADLDLVARQVAPAPCPVVGHSMGGRVALWFAAHHPERVRGVGLLDTRLDTVDAAVVAQYRGRIRGARVGRSYPTREDAMAAFRFVPDEPGVPPAVVRMLAFHGVHEREPGAWTFRFDRAVLSPDGDGAGDLHRLLPRVRCPAWVVGARGSWVCDADHRARIVAALPHATSGEFPGAHHFLLSHGAATGAALRRFLDALAPSP